MAVEFPVDIIMNDVSLDADAEIYAPGITTDDYSALANKPSINGNVLIGDKSTEELGIDHVALADNLVSRTGTTNTSPYTLRSAPSYAGSVAELRKIVGGTVVWNQLFPTKTISSTIGNITVVSNNDGAWVVTLSAAVTDAVVFENITSLSATAFTANHVYAWFGKANGDNIRFYMKGYAHYTNSIFKVATASFNNISLSVRNTSAGTYKVFPMLLDLTAMFGSTVAEAVLAMSSSDAIAFVQNLCPSAYYPYSACSLQSVQATARKVVGFNQWDEEWQNGYYDKNNGGAFVANASYVASKNMIPVIPNTEYYVNINAVHQVFWYDGQGGFISANPSYSVPSTYTSPSGACYMAFYCGTGYGNTYLHNICINLSDSALNGQYQPYKAKSYPIDDVVLRGIPKLTNGALYYDGDLYLPTGEVTRKYATITIDGTETYWYAVENNPNIYNVVFTDFTNAPKHQTTNVMSSPLYTPTAWNYTTMNGNDFAVCFRNNESGTRWRIYVKTAETTLANLKTYLGNHPLTLVYELATPTTETADPYTEMQLVDNQGSEQFVTTNFVPVGNETFYPMDLTGVVQDLAPLPTTAGTYKLKVTVSGGVPSYSWVAG